ncbi:hypothetical protein B0T26DRAFT_806955 [Lasiosphaeria miniovina]|uniref:Uncharacterized protein n=1 Tax=Lasiosphaeria miniovina TaxID=1954250 RepID=A0AA40DHJ6_9PEZI|nr:uncharacterized protein B0T26DRAFT_806955 [Lasiosphaeria miniovina]KAK0703370.1 hypothetical protein B0T26DRAFT_806955 [Lasiosphaeria miniovina]
MDYPHSCSFLGWRDSPESFSGPPLRATGPATLLEHLPANILLNTPISQIDHYRFILDCRYCRDPGVFRFRSRLCTNYMQAAQSHMSSTHSTLFEDTQHFLHLATFPVACAEWEVQEHNEKVAHPEMCQVGAVVLVSGRNELTARILECDSSHLEYKVQLYENGKRYLDPIWRQDEEK